MAPRRDDTPPETPLPKALERAGRLAEAETDIEWIKDALVRIEARPHVCFQERQIEGIVTWRKIVGGVLTALALCILGLIGTVLVTCQQTGHAQGVVETRIEDHSRRITAIEQSLSKMDEARRADTVRILEAIREANR